MGRRWPATPFSFSRPTTACREGHGHQGGATCRQLSGWSRHRPARHRGKGQGTGRRAAVLLPQPARRPTGCRRGAGGSLLAVLSTAGSARRVAPSSSEEPGRPSHRPRAPDLPSCAPRCLLQRRAGADGGRRTAAGVATGDAGLPPLDRRQAARLPRSDARAQTVEVCSRHPTQQGGCPEGLKSRSVPSWA